MFFGTQPRPKPGLLGMFAPGQATMAPQMQQQPTGGPTAIQSMVGNMPAKKPGPNWVGIGADFLSGLAGQPGGYAASLQHQKLLDQQAQQAETKRQADWEDFQRQEQFKRDNPMPVNNDTVNDYQFILQQSGPEAANQYLQGRYDPVVNIPLGDGRTYIGPRSGAPAAVNGMGGGQAPQRPVGKLTPIEGGVGGNPGGGFPG